MAEQILQHEPAHARSRGNDGQNKQRLKHDGEVVPESENRPAASGFRKDMSHAQRKRRSATGTIEQILLANIRRQRIHLLR